MTGPHPAVAAVRTAVRRLLDSVEVDRVAVAVSGGADSLALAAAATFVAPRLGLAVHGLVVDHGLQDGSDRVAADTAKALHAMDFTEVQVLPVEVTGPGGPEAAARRARYDALRTAVPGAMVLLGHTRDDQAETVLLGLGRGSGPRSIAGMRPVDPPWLRPFLDVARETTVAACAALDLRPWQDPHNADPRFTRVRLRREVLPLLEDVLAGGVSAALARTAAQLREDTEALDAIAARFTGEPDIEALARQPAAVRRRVLRRWLLAQGVRELTDAQLRGVDGLITEWRGQGAVWVAGGLEVGRAHGSLTVTQPPR
jgi:tRNA(Ile)-lysidine synthase